MTIWCANSWLGLAVAVVITSSLPHTNFAAVSCPNVGGSVSLSGSCTLRNFKAQGCDPTTLGLKEAQVQQLCENAGITFGSITNKYYQFDKTHMDGGGHWNIAQDGLANALDLQTDAARIGRFAKNVAPNTRINWPIYSALNNYTNPVFGNNQQRQLDETNLNTLDSNAQSNAYMSNFNLTDSCTLNTVMCCFISNRLSKTFVPNANVCNLRLDKAKHSNHVQNGYGTYDSSTPAYCVGFTWSLAPSDPTSRFKGNALFDVAYNTMFQKGYVENIPGAPMCGCLEQMPVVTRADCRQVKVIKEAYIVSRPKANQWVITTDTNRTSLSYANCATDLKTAAQLVFRTSKAKKVLVGAQLVGKGQCKAANAALLNDEFWTPNDVATISTFTTTVNPKQWTQVAGTGSYFFPVRDSLDVQDANFRRLLGNNGPPYPLIYRICPSCLPSHRHIYYKRLTEIPTNMNFLHLFLNNFTTANSTSNPNILGQDFELYSTLSDATEGINPWTYCVLDTNQGYGFPGSCGPSTYTACQWNRYNDDMCDRDDFNAWFHGFFVQK